MRVTKTPFGGLLAFCKPSTARRKKRIRKENHPVNDRNVHASTEMGYLRSFHELKMPTTRMNNLYKIEIETSFEIMLLLVIVVDLLV